MAPHFLFWPFDVDPAPHEKERIRAVTHIIDALRLGVLAQEEGAELRWEGHVMQCPQCHDPALSLWEQLPKCEGADPSTPHVSCAAARNGVFRYMEQGRGLELATLTHLLSCPDCAEHFVEPAKNLYRLEVDEDSVSAQD